MLFVFKVATNNHIKIYILGQVCSTNSEGGKMFTGSLILFWKLILFHYLFINAKSIL